VRKWERFSGLARSCEVLIACELPLQGDTIAQAWYSIFPSKKAKAYFDQNGVGLDSLLPNRPALRDCLKAIEDPRSERFPYGLKEFDTDNAANRPRVQSARSAAEQVRIITERAALEQEENEREAARVASYRHTQQINYIATSSEEWAKKVNQEVEEVHQVPPSRAQIYAAEAQTRTSREKLLCAISWQWFGDFTFDQNVKSQAAEKRLQECVKVLMSDHEIRIGYFAHWMAGSLGRLFFTPHLTAWFVSERPLQKASILAAWRSVAGYEKELSGPRREQESALLKPYDPKCHPIKYPYNESADVFRFGLKDFMPDIPSSSCTVQEARRAAEQVQTSKEDPAEQARKREAEAGMEGLRRRFHGNYETTRSVTP
jgi:hypothetical protein